MKEKRFLKKEALEYGWHTYREKPGFFILMMVCISVLQYIPTYLGEQMGAGESMVLLSAVLMQTLVGVAVIGIALKVYRKEQLDARDLTIAGRGYLDYFVASLIYGFAVFAGSFLFIVPGIIAGIMFSFYGYLIVDRGLGAFEALKASKELVEGAKMDLFLMGIILFLINVAGGMLLLVGLLITTPVSIMAVTHIYKKLSEGQVHG